MASEDIHVLIIIYGYHISYNLFLISDKITPLLLIITIGGPAGRLKLYLLILYNLFPYLNMVMYSSYFGLLYFSPIAMAVKTNGKIKLIPDMQSGIASSLNISIEV